MTFRTSSVFFQAREAPSLFAHQPLCDKRNKQANKNHEKSQACQVLVHCRVWRQRRATCNVDTVVRLGSVGSPTRWEFQPRKLRGSKTVPFTRTPNILIRTYWQEKWIALFFDGTRSNATHETGREMDSFLARRDLWRNRTIVGDEPM